MFTRHDLFTLRDRFTEAFHTAPDRDARERAFEMVMRINERLLRVSRDRLWRRQPLGATA